MLFYLGSKDRFGAVSDHVEHLVLAQVLLVLCQSTLLDHHPVQSQLHRRPLHDLLVDGVLGDQPEHLDLLLLTDPVRPIHGLQIHLGVPVGVEKDDDVGNEFIAFVCGATAR